RRPLLRPRHARRRRSRAAADHRRAELDRRVPRPLAQARDRRQSPRHAVRRQARLLLRLARPLARRALDLVPCGPVDGARGDGGDRRGRDCRSVRRHPRDTVQDGDHDALGGPHGGRRRGIRPVHLVCEPGHARRDRCLAPHRVRGRPRRAGLAAQARALATQVERDGGTTLAIYQEPVGDHWQIFCLLPRERVEASPYQRDLSPTHVKRLTESIKRLDRFVDPIVVISPKPGVYWTPNGNHRRAVLDKLRADSVPAILVVEPAMVFEVLPLNVEKAHNLKEKSLEVIRMYRALAKDEPSSPEERWQPQFESAHFITLGLLYEENKRFAGGAFAPILRRVDKFLKLTLAKGLEERQERA